MRTVENLSALKDIVWGIKYGWFTTLNILKYPRFWSKMIKTNSLLVCLLCFFSIFAVLGFLCHYCSSLHKTESRQHTCFDRFQLGGGLRPENPSDQKFFRPQLRLYDPSTRTNFFSSKILAHYAGNEHFPPSFPWLLLSAASCDIAIGHGCGKGWWSRSNFALPRVVQSVTYWCCFLTLIDCATLGSAKFDLDHQPFPGPWPIAISQDAAERSGRGKDGGKCSFSA